MKKGSTSLLIIDGSDIDSDKDRCNKCYYFQSDGRGNENCFSFDETPSHECKKMRYYYVENKRNHKDRYATLDMSKLSLTCSDFCIYYGKNCYNKERSVCLIRLIEMCSIK